MKNYDPKSALGKIRFGMKWRNNKKSKGHGEFMNKIGYLLKGAAQETKKMAEKKGLSSSNRLQANILHFEGLNPCTITDKEKSNADVWNQHNTKVRYM